MNSEDQTKWTEIQQRFDQLGCVFNDDAKWLISQLKAWQQGPITEAMLRQHDGYVHLDKSVELAIAGTTKDLIAAQQTIAQKDAQIRQLREAVKELNDLTSLYMVPYFDTEHPKEIVLEYRKTIQNKHGGIAGLWADMCKIAIQALSTTPAPDPVVPWSVVKEAMDAEWAVHYLTGEELKEGLKRRDIARAKLQSYAPQPAEKKGNQ